MRKNKQNNSMLFDSNNNPIPLNRVMRKSKGQVKAFFSGFKSANDENLADWALLPLDINTILRNDLKRLRAQARDLARNDDTTKRFLSILKQNVLGYAGIRLQAKNKIPGSNVQDTAWNTEIEREWSSFCSKRRVRGVFESPSACGSMSFVEISWLALASKAIDGECFIQVLRGYPHNKHKFAVRFLNPDLLDNSFCVNAKDGTNRVEMGIEFDKFDRPIAYHFNDGPSTKLFIKGNQRRIRIPADQIIHMFRHEYVGQIRGIPDFVSVIHKTKMLNGVHEALVVGWRVAAAKMGFFVSNDPDAAYSDVDGDQMFPESQMDAVPGGFEVLPEGYDIKEFNPDYPSSTFESSHGVFMQQLANGYNVSSPTLSNNYSGVNYSSLRQALLEDREGWRCVQAEMADGFYRPIFEDWYDWTANVTGLIKHTPMSDQELPTVVCQPRGWPWVDPLKEVNAQAKAVESKFRTRQSVISETTGADFTDTADELRDEQEILLERGLMSSVVNLEENNEGDDEEKLV